MYRFASLALVALFSCTALAADAPAEPYSVTADATRTDGAISVSVKVTRNEPSASPVGKTKVTTVTAPKLKLKDGQRALVAVGETRPSPNGAPLPADPREITSGCKIDVLSIKGRDQLLVVTTIIDDGQTIWADATKITITPKPADKPQ